jgi:hypothetical protein
MPKLSFQPAECPQAQWGLLYHYSPLLTGHSNQCLSLAGYCHFSFCIAKVFRELDDVLQILCLELFVTLRLMVNDNLMTNASGSFGMLYITEEEPTDDEFFAALSKTWTRIGMGKVALANSLVGRPILAPDEIIMLTKALVPEIEGE